MSNKFTRPIETAVIRNKIDALSSVLKESFANKDLATLEQLVVEANQILASYYQDIKGPLFDPEIVLPGSLPDPSAYNGDFQAIYDDLSILFKELENLEGVVLKNFDYFVSESNRLNRKVKAVSSKLGDYILFAGNSLKDAMFFGDSFNNLDNVEIDQSLYEKEQAEVNQAEGIVTLPVIKSSQTAVPILGTPVINSNSNGVAGNNQEIDALLNGDVTDILDGNSDTWFEYERVVTPANDDGTPLLLDMRLDLTEAKIINFIRINPNNFGTRTQVEIVDISTSLDGESFISIKDEIPIPGFNTADEANIFTLAPSTSKYAGQGLFTFTPRKARYVHLVLKQSSPYTIRTLTGLKNRYAIGLRDVEVQALQYKTEGEIVSVDFEAPEEIRKLALLVTQSPTEESELVSIKHYISPDNGDTWVEIRPKGFSGLSDVVNQIPEILDFNSHLDNSIETDIPVGRVRYKAVLKRETSAFKEGASSLRKNVKFKTELHQVPATTPFSIGLEESPVAGTVQLVDPHFGSRGDSHRYAVAIANESAQIYKLPWTQIPLDQSKTNPGSGWVVNEVNSVNVYVNGEQWSSSNLNTANRDARVFNIDYARGLLRFGNGVRGRTPDEGSVISLSLTPERLLTVPAENSHRAKLLFPTNGDKKSVTIKRTSPPRESAEALPKLSKVFRLKNQNLVSGSVKFKPAGGAFVGNPQTFVDGKVELTASGHWSIDYESGIIYSFDATGAVSEVAVSYQYNPVETLSENDWDFEDTKGLKDEVIIWDRAWSTNQVKDESLPSAVKKFSLEKFNVEPGSLVFSDTVVFAKEVPFVDGRTEILGLIKASEVVPAFSTWTSLGGSVYAFSTSLIPADTTNHPISFTNTTLFANQVTAPPLANGQYSVDEVNREIRVFTSTAPASVGSMSYLYQDPTKTLTGVYSVDYKRGTVYTFDATPVSLKATYQHSDLEIHYPIARVIPSADYEVDAEAKSIKISDREILRKTQIPAVPAATGGTGNTYQVLYNYVQESRAGVAELEPYFSPVLKEYAIKLLTKSRLF